MSIQVRVFKKASVVFLLTLFLLSACNQEPENHYITGSTMGTTYTVTLPNLNLATSDKSKIGKKIELLLAEVNQKMSTYRADSEISQFNKWQSLEWFSISKETLSVIISAIELAKKSQGAYDITAGPLVNLWGFGPTGKRVKPPSDLEIANAKAQIGFQYIETRQSPPAVRKRLVNLYVDLSSIAKGYAVDVVASFLESEGIKNFLVEIGGELKAKGQNATGRFWRIGIEKPVSSERSLQQIIEIVDAGVATSGDYRNFFEEDGARYSHTIDVRTGRPISHNLASVTVVLPSVKDADAWATALLVLGEKAGFELAEREQIPAYFVIKADQGFSVRMTEVFTEKLIN